MEVVPHIVIGLHYGRLLGEENALDIISRYRVAALILVIVSPIYAPADKPFATIGTDDVAKVFVAARERIRHAPVQLGCIRPAGRHKLITDVRRGFVLENRTRSAKRRQALLESNLPRNSRLELIEADEHWE